MRKGHEWESTDEYLEALKLATSRLTQETLSRHGEDSPMSVRVQELNGAIQRLEWEIERQRARITNKMERGLSASE